MGHPKIATERTAVTMDIIEEAVKHFTWAQGVQIYADNTPILAGIGAIYLPLVFGIKALMANRQPFRMQLILAAWNFLLGGASFFGALIVVPVAVDQLSRPSWECNDEWQFGSPLVAAAVFFFNLSKVPEMGDSVFLALRKRPIIFLHWFHHITVFLYCWHSMLWSAPYGLYFAAMNLCVHSVMYTYYGLESLRIRIPFPIVITFLQIAQMMAGMFIAVSVYLSPCGEKYDQNVYLGLAMYTSYWILFVLFMINRFCMARPTKPDGTKDKPDAIKDKQK